MIQPYGSRECSEGDRRSLSTLAAVPKRTANSPFPILFPHPLTHLLKRHSLRDMERRVCGRNGILRKTAMRRPHLMERRDAVALFESEHTGSDALDHTRNVIARVARRVAVDDHFPVCEE